MKNFTLVINTDVLYPLCLYVLLVFYLIYYYFFKNFLQQLPSTFSWQGLKDRFRDIGKYNNIYYIYMLSTTTSFYFELKTFIDVLYTFFLGSKLISSAMFGNKMFYLCIKTKPGILLQIKKKLLQNSIMICHIYPY